MTLPIKQINLYLLNRLNDMSPKKTNTVIVYGLWCMREVLEFTEFVQVIYLLFRDFIDVFPEPSFFFQSLKPS